MSSRVARLAFSSHGGVPPSVPLCPPPLARARAFSGIDSARLRPGHPALLERAAPKWNSNKYGCAAFAA